MTLPLGGARLIALAAIGDVLAGDPAWLPHPVRFVGAACVAGERLARRTTNGDARRERRAGAVLTYGLVGATYALAHLGLGVARRRSRRAGTVLALVLAWTTLAARSLFDEAGAVLAALEHDDLSLARVRLARIVGRDTAHLDVAEIARATIETLAESTCDGVMAPLVALALGGVPLALTFKTASTLDSMIGHIEAPYTHFGRAAAQLDDRLCWVPARLTAAAICALAPVARGVVRRALATWQRDGDAHRSPNAGQCEAAIAGALGVRLGGCNAYDGVPHDGPVFGREFVVPDVVDVRRARRLAVAVALAAALGATATRAVVERLFEQGGRDAR